VTGHYQDRDSLPRMTISMLGADKSGKSSYILGMFAALVRGQLHHQYALSAASQAVSIAMQQELDDLCAGNPPKPTDEPKTHEFTLRGGLAGAGRAGGVQTGIAALDLIDFRGGTMRELPEGDNDAARYFARLPKSDSIFVVLDSRYFREPVTPDRQHAVAQDTWAYRIGDLIGWAIEKREEAGLAPPSIVVLLTKWDLLEQWQPIGGRGLAEVYDDVQALLPKVFGVGLEQYVFSVSIGQFSDLDGNPRQATINLSSIEKPVFFATGCFLTHVTERLYARREPMLADRAAIAARLAMLTWWPPSIQSLLFRARIDRRRAELTAKDAEIAALDLHGTQIAEHQRVLRSLAE